MPKRTKDLTPTKLSGPITEGINPFWTTSDRQTVKLYHGHVVDVLARLPAQSVQCVVTSPPYWGLRDYGVEGQIGSEPSPDCNTHGKAQCGKCFVCVMVNVFTEVKRVLRDDGTLWLNLGDTYGGVTHKSTDSHEGNDGLFSRKIAQFTSKQQHDLVMPKSGLRQGNLVGIPWRVALALQANGWILRQDIIWHKPAPMPESVRNRCTKAHEYIFLLTKSSRYYYDAESVREKTGNELTPEEYESVRMKGDWNEQGLSSYGAVHIKKNDAKITPPGGRNKRSVWTVSSQGYEGAHFATFPPKLITPCILAGTSEKGCCSQCGKGWVRIIEKGEYSKSESEEYERKEHEENPHNQSSDMNKQGGGYWPVKTLGWEPDCDCRAINEDGDDVPYEPVPCVVMDPFIGSGTTCCVSVAHGRASVGVDLSEKYLEKNAIPRIEGELGSRPATAHLIPRKVQSPLSIGKPLLKSGTAESVERQDE